MVMTAARRRGFTAASASLCLLFATASSAAAVAVHTVRTDLKPLIRAASESPAQFAVLLPDAVSSAGGGTWSSAGGQATWRYAVQVPTAVSMSFHAVQVSLPASATLIVRGATTTTSYRARDLHRGELWSRIQPGAGLEFTLSVAASERTSVAFRLVSLQAGYRSLGAGVQDHPYYRQLRQTLLVDNTSCVTNYACRVTPANTPAGAATVALIVLGLYQCSGTLINDVPQDNTPYVLTARHCLTGKVGIQDDPSRAATLQVYWDATTACGATLGSLYDPGTPTQTGATTMVEQQDAWLVRLDVNPMVPDAQFAGFDASGAAVQGGYSIHHAEGSDKQFVAWSGQAALADRFAGFSKFLETVNQSGNIGPGASGSALFDQNNRLVGSLTYGRDSSDPSGYGSCPLPVPPPPDGNNGVADFTALAAVWNSTTDATSSTGAATLKSVLDPHHSGALVVPSISAALVSLSASTDTLSFGAPLQLTWSASNATQCSASGGAAGDGWSGTLGTAGSRSVTETVPNLVSYTISCSYSAGRSATATVTVNWLGPTPQLQFSGPPNVWTTRPATLSWSSNVAPCSISGGGLNLADLPMSGSTTTTQSTPADVSYVLTCGPPNDFAATQAVVSYVTPGVLLEANGTDRRLGEDFFLQWLTYADSCTPSGGAPGDGWSSNSFSGGSVILFFPQVTAGGVYTYTLTCASGALTVQADVTVTFENDPPYVRAALEQPTVTFSGSPADYVNLSYTSNVSGCTLNSDPNILSFDDNPFGRSQLPQGRLTLSPERSGSFALSVSCQGAGGAVSSPPLTLTVRAPAPATASISFSPATVVAGENLLVSWTSNGTSACSQSGGMPGALWGSSPGAFGPPAGSDSEIAQVGQFTYGLTCLSIDPASPAVSINRYLDVLALSNTLTASATAITVGDSFTLTWTSTAASSCSASGGGANGEPWSGTLPTAGSLTQTATTDGRFTYELACGVNDVIMAQDVTLTVSPRSSAPSAGGGGGGALGLLELASLAALGGRRGRTRRRAKMRPPISRQRASK